MVKLIEGIKYLSENPRTALGAYLIAFLLLVVIYEMVFDGKLTFNFIKTRQQEVFLGIFLIAIGLLLGSVITTVFFSFIPAWFICSIILALAGILGLLPVKPGGLRYQADLPKLMGNWALISSITSTLIVFICAFFLFKVELPIAIIFSLVVGLTGGILFGLLIGMIIAHIRNR